MGKTYAKPSYILYYKDGHLLSKCAAPENIHTPPMEGFLFCTPLLLGNFSLASYFACKILTFKTLLPLGISDDLPWGAYVYFLELHNSWKLHKYFFRLPVIHILGEHASGTKTGGFKGSLHTCHS